MMGIDCGVKWSRGSIPKSLIDKKDKGLLKHFSAKREYRHPSPNPKSGTLKSGSMFASARSDAPTFHMAIMRESGLVVAT